MGSALGLEISVNGFMTRIILLILMNINTLVALLSLESSYSKC